MGSIMKGGAVALDARIEPGDMILQVIDVKKKLGLYRILIWPPDIQPIILPDTGYPAK